MSISYRQYRDADRHQASRTIAAAFDDDGRAAQLAAALRARSDLQTALVAEDDGRIVGYVQLSISWLDAPAGLITVLTLSPLAVVPDRQRAGIATQMLVRARTAAHLLGVPALFLEGDPGFYGPRGWLRAGEHGIRPPSVRIPLPAFQFFPFPDYEPRRMTGALVYNDTFWSQNCVGPRD